MRIVKWLYAFFFGCFHTHTTFPMTVKQRTYVVCLKCGEELDYNWETMTLTGLSRREKLRPRPIVIK